MPHNADFIRKLRIKLIWYKRLTNFSKFVYRHKISSSFGGLIPSNSSYIKNTLYKGNKNSHATYRTYLFPFITVCDEFFAPRTTDASKENIHCSINVFRVIVKLLRHINFDHVKPYIKVYMSKILRSWSQRNPFQHLNKPKSI